MKTDQELRLAAAQAQLDTLLAAQRETVTVRQIRAELAVLDEQIALADLNASELKPAVAGSRGELTKAERALQEAQEAVAAARKALSSATYKHQTQIDLARTKRGRQAVLREQLAKELRGGLPVARWGASSGVK